MDVRLPDGRILRNVPEGTTKAEIQAKLGGVQQQKESIARTAFDQGMQGLTFGFADEITDRLGAGIASAFSPELSYNNAYEEARQLTKERQQRQLEQNPATSIAANIAGGLLTGGAGATTKAGAAIGNSLRTGSLGSRIAKSALTGAASGGLYGAGTAEDDERIPGAASGAAIGGAIGGLVPAAGARLKKLNTKTIIPNADQIRARAGQLFQKAERSGGTLSPQFTNKFVDTIESMKPQTEIGQIVGGDSAFTKVVDKISGIKNKPMSLQAAQELDELLGDAIDSFTEMGHVTKQGKKLLDVQSTLRGMIDDIGEDAVIGGKQGFDALKEARKMWSTSYRMNDIERIIQRAEQYDTPATAIKTGFRTLYNNPSKMRGYSKVEREAIKKAAESGVVTDVLRTFGSRLLPIGAAVSGGGLGASTAAAAGSMASRGLATKSQLGRAGDVARQIAERSGMVTQTPRIDLKELMKLPPKKAKELLSKMGVK